MRRSQFGAFLLLFLVVAAFALWASGQKEPATQSTSAAPSGAFDWKRYSGQTIQFLADDNPVGQLLQQHASEFTALTGIQVTVSLYSEQQFRQRLQTILQAKSSDVDLFMSLVSLEGKTYAKAGWYTDIYPLVKNTSLTSPDYNFSDFGSGVIKSNEESGQLTGVPMNIEGPVLYYRTDVFQKCGISPPTKLEDLPVIAQKLKSCAPNMIPIASRGLAAAVPYTFSNFFHNFGGAYQDAQGMSNLSTPQGIQAIDFYAKLLKDYGPPGVINYSFPQLTAAYSNGQTAMSFESSNEFGGIMKSGARTNDTAITVLPPGPAGSVPVVIGWELSISAFSQKTNPAWYFLQWASTKDMEVTLGLQGLAPPRTSVWDDPKFVDWLNQVPVRKQWASALSTLAKTGSGLLAPQILLQPQSRQIIGQAVGSVVLGQASAAQAAKSADDQINALIKQSGNQ
ncbi:MAG TPA: extracellular solute-binding protein [Spirochaetia bacterium]|nr:extracellular solute-binding protein [Spirochaetia bacterium]